MDPYTGGFRNDGYILGSDVVHCSTDADIREHLSVSISTHFHLTTVGEVVRQKLVVALRRGYWPSFGTPGASVYALLCRAVNLGSAIISNTGETSLIYTTDPRGFARKYREMIAPYLRLLDIKPAYDNSFDASVSKFDGNWMLARRPKQLRGKTYIHALTAADLMPKHDPETERIAIECVQTGKVLPIR